MKWLIFIKVEPLNSHVTEFCNYKLLRRNAIQGEKI